MLTLHDQVIMKQLTVKEIANFLNAEISGNPDQLISGFNGILEAQEGDITFLANVKYKKQLPLCKASAVVVGEDVEVDGVNLVKVNNPRLAFARLVSLLVPKKKENGQISPQAFISDSASIGQNVTIYPNAYVGENSKIADNSTLYPGVFIGDNVSIGENCLLYANVSVHHEVKLGSNVVVNSGTVIGSEGFGFERDGEKHFKIPQVGNVIIEDDVEIGALCAIDRGSVKPTIIGKGTKLDNLVHVAHNCHFGENNLILAQAGIAGTVTTGKSVYIAGQAGCLDHINITDYVQLGGKGVFTSNVEEPGVYFGYPAKPVQEWQKASAMFYKTDELRKKTSALEKKIQELEEKLEN